MKGSRLIVMGLVLAGCSGPEPASKDNMVVVITDGTNNGMTCPACGDGEVCVDGFCQIEGCEPTCEGTACGPNGCGGMCNPCEGRAQCVDGACELAPMDCSGFADDPQSWTIPQNLFEQEQFERTAGSGANCGGADGTFTYQLLDLTGDGRTDLVLTDRCDSAGVGTTRWDVYENTGSGFAADPTSWAIPQNQFQDEQFDRIAGSGNNCGGASGDYNFGVLDLTGDGRPDLVLTDRCDTAGVGTVRWDVYENTGSGFAAEPTTWALPQGQFQDEQFDRTANSGNDCGGASGNYTFGLLDLTGNGRPDLVVTNRCDTAGVGTARWDVYENTGSGFAADATSWAIPQNQFQDEQFDRIAGSGNDCGGASGNYTFGLLDLTGDGKADLVVTNRCDTAGVGTSRWDVYENTGSGFAADPTTWALPENQFQDDQFDQFAGSGSDCGGASESFTYQVMDMDADGMPDLLVSDRCDGGGVGTTRWEYHRNQGDGFADEPTTWTVPTMFVDEQFETVADVSGDCGSLSGEIAYSVVDLDADGALDLVLTDRCDAGGVGTLRWDVHPANCN